MNIKRLSGLHGNLMTNHTRNTMYIQGANSNSSQYARVEINGNSVGAITSSSGLYLIVFDEDLNLISTDRFTLYPNSDPNRGMVDFIEKVSTLPPRRYYALCSNGEIYTDSTLDDFMTNTLGSSLWEDMWMYHNHRYGDNQASQKVSYVSFGTSSLGITHEDYGVGAEVAAITPNIGNYDNFMSWGYGTTVYELSNESYGTSYATIDIDADDISHAMHIAVRCRNAINSDDIKVVQVNNGSTNHEYSLDNTISPLYATASITVPKNTNTIRFDILLRNIDLSSLVVSEANSSDGVEFRSGMVKRSDGLTTGKFEFGLSGFDVNDTSHINNRLSMDNVTDNSGTTNINGISASATNIAGLQQLGSTDIDYTRDYTFSFFSQNTGTGNNNVRVYAEGYDGNGDVINSIGYYTQVSIPRHLLGSYIANDQEFTYHEFCIVNDISDDTNTPYLVMNSYGDVENGGISRQTTIDDVMVLNSDIVGIRFFVESDMGVDIIAPNVDMIKFALSKTNKFIGTVVES